MISTLRNTTSRLSSKIGINLNYIFKNVAINNSVFLIVSAFNILINILLARFLSIEDVGYYKQILLFVNFLSIFTIQGADTNLTISIAKNKGNVFKQALLFKSIGFFVVLFILSCYSIYMYGNNPTFYTALLIAGPLLLSQYIWNLFKAPLTANKNFFLIGKLQIVFSAIHLSSIFIPLYFFQNYLYAILSYSVFTTSYSFFNFIKYFHSLSPQAPDKDFNKSTLFESIILGLNSILNKLDHILITILFSPAHFAIYSIADSFFSIFRNLIKSSVSILFPKLITNNPNLIKKKLLKLYIPIVLISLFIIIVLFLLTPILITFLFGPKFQDSILPAQILLFGLLLWPITILINSIYRANRFYTASYFAIFLHLLIKSICLLVGSRYGLIGLAAAVSISRSIYSVSLFTMYLLNCFISPSSK